MTGAFAKAAHDWHEAGCVVIPLGGANGKRPIAKHWNKWSRQRPETVAQLARKNPNANLGIGTGAPSALTVVDVDDRADLPKALKLFGDTPFQTRTPRAAHLFYRYNGEGSSVRPVPGLDADIRGRGGLVVAPPTVRPDGGKYVLDAGSLADLRDLPTINPDALPAPLARCPKTGKPSRNQTLVEFARLEYRHCDDFDQFLDSLRTWATGLPNPETDEEIFRTAMSVWNWSEDGNNWCGGEARAVLTKPEIEAWPSAHLRSGDAMLLLSRLKVEHGWRNGGTFKLANAFRGSFGWSLRRFQDTRGLLEDIGPIECLHRGGSGKNDPPVYRLVKVRNLLTNSNKSPAPHSREG